MYRSVSCTYLLIRMVGDENLLVSIAGMGKSVVAEDDWISTNLCPAGIVAFDLCSRLEAAVDDRRLRY